MSVIGIYQQLSLREKKLMLNLNVVKRRHVPKRRESVPLAESVSGCQQASGAKAPKES